MDVRKITSQLDPEQANLLLSSLFEIAGIMNARHLGFGKRLDRLLHVILQYLGAEQGSLMVLEGKKLFVRAATRSEIVGSEQKISDGSVAAWVANNALPLYIPDISRDDRFVPRGGTYKKDSLLSVPVIYRDKVIGVINATDKTGAKDLLKEDVSNLLCFSSFILWSFIQKNLQNKITNQRNTLKKRNAELRYQQIMRDKLSRMLVHDLKAPLSEVVANLDILSYSIQDDQKEFLEAAQMGCDRSVQMVSNLVSVDKISDGKLQLLYEETSAHDLLAEAISFVKGTARMKGIEVEQEHCDEGLVLKVDRTLILRVLQNLLANSLSYCTSPASVWIGAAASGPKKVEFYVQDTGPGIAPEQQSSIFNKYARVSDKQDALVGTGLGLHFCKLAVELHRGKISVKSRPGEGSRFFFTLPIT